MNELRRLSSASKAIEAEERAQAKRDEDACWQAIRALQTAQQQLARIRDEVSEGRKLDAMARASDGLDDGISDIRGVMETD